jgi:hypothetical protein
MPEGTVSLMVGSSSKDIRLTEQLTIEAASKAQR